MAGTGITTVQRPGKFLAEREDKEELDLSLVEKRAISPQLFVHLVSLGVIYHRCLFINDD